MFGIVKVRKPYKGCPLHAGRLAAACGTGQAKADRYSEAPDGVFSDASPKRVRGEWAKARSRLTLADPRRAKPMGAASGRRRKTASDARDSRKGQSPGTAARRAGPTPSATVATAGKTVSGSFRAETRRIPCGRGKLRRANPRSAAGVKQNRHGLGGSKPPRG
jgi:hypothetical protein